MSRVTLAMVAVSLVAAACSSTVDVADTSGTSETSQTSQTSETSEITVTEAQDAIVDAVAEADAARPVVEALWWTAETTDGGELDATSLAGQNIVLWMWAPWCSVCNREAPDVARALADLPDDVTIIGVAGRDDLDEMQAFVVEHNLEGIQHVVDDDGSVWASYGISYQPAWVFIAADGEAAVAAGAIGYDGLFAGIEQVFGGA